jgi:hypothetical protein
MTDEKNAMKIIKPSAEPSNEAPTKYFTGSVRVTPPVKGENPSCLTCASVGFEAALVQHGIRIRKDSS